MFAASAIVSVDSPDVRRRRRCVIRWAPVGRWPDSSEPFNSTHVSMALIADYARRMTLVEQHAHINLQLRRTRNTPVPGQFGVRARRRLWEGDILVFPRDSHSATAARTNRGDHVERNAFRHPTRSGVAIDAVPGSLLQSINSTWNGVDAHECAASAQLFYVRDEFVAIVTRAVCRGEELRFDYKWAL